MEVTEALKQRRSIRKFLDREVPGEDVHKILEAARLAPSGLNAQPWRFKVVQDKDQISWLADEALKGQHWVKGAQVVFICCADLGRYLEDAGASVRMLGDSGVVPPEMLTSIEEYVRDAEKSSTEMLRCAAATNCSIAITQMMLQAVDLGLGTCWIGMYEEEIIKDRFELPEHMAVVALLAAGYPAENPAPRPRKAMEEIVLR